MHNRKELREQRERGREEKLTKEESRVREATERGSDAKRAFWFQKVYMGLY